MQGPIWTILVANEKSQWVLSYKIVSNDMSCSLSATEAQKCQKGQSHILSAIDALVNAFS